MPQEHFPVLWLGQAAVVSVPVEIDITVADQVREDLLSVLNRGPAALIVDMGGTTFCDSAGVHALVRAHKRAAASRTAMLLVVTSPAVQRVLAITGVDRLIGVSTSVAEALAATGQSADDQKPPPGPAEAHAGPDEWAAHPR
ncbi:MAG TPA: STAS domain-containing protein [Streptosporangiaceae bacterium]|nr:STAS domain-containing protein [Streptosporangiaceae bacterium]